MESLPKKTCSKCLVEKSAGEFHKGKANKDGLQVSCKKCQSEAHKIFAKRNRDRGSIAIPSLKTCPVCDSEKPFSEFGKTKSTKDGLQGLCKKCQARNKIKARYGISLEQYGEILVSQGGSCAICGFSPGPKDGPLHVDHDHVTGKNRGLLCGPCNRGLGHFKEQTKHD